MKTKKIVSIVLAVIMVLGLLPLSAIAQSDWIGTVKNGHFVDEGAVPEKSYQYTVRGNDGSNQSITVLGLDSDTGIKVVKIADVGTYYVKLKDPSTVDSNTAALIVANDRAVVNHIDKTFDKTNYTLNYDTDGVNIEKNTYFFGDVIKGEHPNDEWYLTKDNNGRYSLSNGSQKLISSVSDGGSWGNYWADYWFGTLTDNPGNKYNESQWDVTISGDTIKFYMLHKNVGLGWETYGESGISLQMNGDKFTRQRYYQGGSAGGMHEKARVNATGFNIYQKHVATADEYVIDDSALSSLIESSKNREDPAFKKNYTEDTWNAYVAAMKDARDAVAANKDKVYVGDAAATNAYNDLNYKYLTLYNAYNGLKLINNLSCVEPTITWQRTYETDEVKKDVKVNHNSDYTELSWNWNDIKDLKVGPKAGTNDVTKVWNYDDTSISAARWDNVGSHTSDWTYSSARRFSGTFYWPQGYDLNDKAVIESKNDANYAKIYEYINNDEALRARYGDGKAKVIPVNDNMYAFISKASEQPSDWTKEDASKRLVFWTGTDGKGKWTGYNRGGDWQRTVPPTFDGRAATPAFKEGYPNNGDIDGSTTWVNLDNSVANKMKHTEEWYSLVDTSNIMTTLKGVYGANEDLDGQLMRIEIFAFDNTGSGGMDEPILRLCKPDENDVHVQINYWLDHVGGVSCGTSYRFALDNSIINLSAGTNANELNFKKGEAIKLAGADATVDDGVQQVKDFVVKKNQENVIDVVYKSNVQGMKYLTYDFATQNSLLYKDTASEAITGVSVENITGATATYSGHDIRINYTPSNAVDIYKRGTLVINREGGHVSRFPIGIIAASNVLYEENFFDIVESNRADWSITNATPVKVDDNEKTVFGFTKEYANSINENGVYKATLTPSGSTRYSDELKFTFSGQGFDLIGTCGKDTGTLMVTVRNAKSGTNVKNYMVNTAFNDASIGDIYQVPIIHCMGLPEGQEYDVVVKGVNINYAQNQSRMSYSLKNSVGSSNNAAYNAMVEMGFSDEEIANTEFINMNDKLGANTFALRNNATTFEAAEPANKTVAIDSIRVYFDAHNSVYPENEQATYTNILDAVTGNIAAYIEGNPNGECNVADYEALGGPQNELYLGKGGSVAFAVDGNVAKTQISARALKGETRMSVSDAPAKTIKHNTEMYYEVDVKDGQVVITNTGDNILAIGNVKSSIKAINEEQKTKAVAMAVRMLNAPQMPEQGTFVPERFDVKLNVVNGLFNRFGTLKITASSDVQYVEINGKKVQADNRLLVNWGLAKNLKYTKRKTAKKGESVEFKIVAYDNFGNSSEPIVISK